MLLCQRDNVYVRKGFLERARSRELIFGLFIASRLLQLTRYYKYVFNSYKKGNNSCVSQQCAQEGVEGAAMLFNYMLQYNSRHYKSTNTTPTAFEPYVCIQTYAGIYTFVVVRNGVTIENVLLQLVVFTLDSCTPRKKKEIIITSSSSYVFPKERRNGREGGKRQFTLSLAVWSFLPTDMHARLKILVGKEV